MSRTAPLAVAAGAVALLAAGGAVASGASSSPAHPAAATTLHLLAAPGGGAGLDLGRKGPSVGDRAFEHGRVSGDATGRFQLVGELVAGDGRHGSERSAVTLQLRTGTIEAEGTHATADRYRVPVLGGTGRYAGARGVAAFAPAGRERVSVTVRLED
jgi:hypothetical protein